MRFIRVHGRVVPINDKLPTKPAGLGHIPIKKAPPTNYTGHAGRSAALGAAVGAGAGIAHLATNLGKRAGNLKAMKFGGKLGAATTALGFAGSIYAVHKGVEAHEKKKSGALEFGKHYAAQAAGSIAGLAAVGAYAGLKIAKGAARRGKFLKL